MFVKKKLLASVAALSIFVFQPSVLADENGSIQATETDTTQAAKAGWQLENMKWYYFDGAGMKLTNTVFDGYLLNRDGAMVENAWELINNQWYYAKSSGKIIRNQWEFINGKWYYFNDAGVALTNTTFDGYLFNRDGAMVENAWELINNQWYFAKASGKFIRNQWERIGGKWFYFNDVGVALTNTTFSGYLFNRDGAMVENAWELINNQWYFAKASGKYLYNQWERIGGKWYFFAQDGTMLSNTVVAGYLFNKDGAMVENAWELINNQWYYAKSSGKYLYNQWERINGKWYYFDATGVMSASKWLGSYYLKDSGAMAENEWIFDTAYNSYFYLKENGAYAANQWIGEYYLKEGGYMAKNEWVEDSWVDEDGKIARNTFVDNNQYYVTANGKKFNHRDQFSAEKQIWLKLDNDWYYNKNGIPATNEWVGNYWLGEDGRMVTSSWVDNDRYYVGNDGAWVQTGSAAVLQIARSYLGVKTGSDTHKKIVDAYNAVLPRPIGYKANYLDDWCDIFVTVMFQEAGLSDLIGRECGVQRHISIMKQKGIWIGRSQPQVGDVVTFDWDGGGFADHIGIVESVKDGKITTIEGNSGSTGAASEVTQVNRKTYAWNDRSILGYGRPNY